MNYIQNAVALKQELDKLRPLSVDDEQRIMQKFRLDWNYHSNNIEGNSLSYGETKALILFGITAQGKPLKDHFEITGHDDAIKWILDVIKEQRPLTENFIRELHKLILKEPYEVDAITPDGKPTKRKINIGVYKKAPNHVKTRTGEIFRFATPEETPALMNDLMIWYREKGEEHNINPILFASEFHYRFIRIHPFDDGNGRTVRILMNFILMKYGYPPVIIKTEDKHNYYAALRQADAGQIEIFIDYIVKNLVNSLELMIKGAKGESIEDIDDFDKEIKILEQKLKEIGPKVEIVKGKESLLKVYKDSILLFLERLISHCKKFEQFYLKVKLSASGNNIGRIQNSLSNDIGDLLAVIVKEIKEESQFISIECYFEIFNHSNIRSFGYTYRFDFRFDNTIFKLVNKSDDSQIIEKLYSQKLTKKEIDKLLLFEGCKHKEYIENRMKEGLRK